MLADIHPTEASLNNTRSQVTIQYFLLMLHCDWMRNTLHCCHCNKELFVCRQLLKFLLLETQSESDQREHIQKNIHTEPKMNFNFLTKDAEKMQEDVSQQRENIFFLAMDQSKNVSKQTQKLLSLLLFLCLRTHHSSATISCQKSSFQTLLFSFFPPNHLRCDREWDTKKCLIAQLWVRSLLKLE